MNNPARVIGFVNVVHFIRAKIKIKGSAAHGDSSGADDSMVQRSQS
jgi:hypothetical protein